MRISLRLIMTSKFKKLTLLSKKSNIPHRVYYELNNIMLRGTIE
jgi:hypothetical protein